MARRSFPCAMGSALLVIGVIVGLAACSRKAAPAPAAPAPAAPAAPAMSKEDAIVKEFNQVLQPLREATKQGAGVDPAREAEMLQGLTAAMNKHGLTNDGKAAIMRVRRNLEESVKTAHGNQQWNALKSTCAALDVVAPGNITSRRYMDYVRPPVPRPEITIKGFFDDKEKGQTIVFLEATVAETGRTVSMRVHEGEEFLDPPYAVRVREIFNDHSGASFELVGSPGETFEVKVR